MSAFRRRRNARPAEYCALRAVVRSRWGRSGLRILDDAYEIAETAVAGSDRATLLHAVHVAALVADWDQPLSSICAALLLDVPRELRDPTVLRAVVGDEITALTALADRITPADMSTSGPLPLGLHEAVLIRLADIVESARGWDRLPRRVAMSRAGEVLLVFAPIAQDLGLRRVRAELLTRAHATLGVAPPELDGDHEDGRDDGTPRVRARSADADEDDNASALAEQARRAATVHAGISGRLLSRAVLLLPPRERPRYLEEWSAELGAHAPGPARVALAAGLLYSAGRLRRRTR